MSSIKINGVTVFVSAIESVEDGVSHEYNRLWRRATNEYMSLAMRANSIEDVEALDSKFDEIEFPKKEAHPAVIVKLTSGREFRLTGVERKDVEWEIDQARWRGENG